MTRNFLIATDFSTRSDRALRRGTLLARQASAELVLAHVVDDDQPRQLAELQEQAAAALLDAFSQTLRDDGISCESRVIFGDPFEGIVRAAKDEDAGLVVIGPHRRQILRDRFLGTTAERTIRLSRTPVIMANGVPAGPYRSIVIATDLSECSFAAAKAAKNLGVLDRGGIIVLHVLDTWEGGPVVRASISMEEAERRLEEDAERASRELQHLMQRLAIEGSCQVVKLGEESIAMAIDNFAKAAQADLIVIGTHGRTGLEKWMLGSVAESVLRISDVDVLVARIVGVEE